MAAKCWRAGHRWPTSVAPRATDEQARRPAAGGGAGSAAADAGRPGPGRSARRRRGAHIHLIATSIAQRASDVDAADAPTRSISLGKFAPPMVAQLWPRVPELALLLLLLLLLNARQSQGQEPQAPPGDAPQVHVQNHQYHAPKIVDGGDSGLEIS